MSSSEESVVLTSSSEPWLGLFDYIILITVALVGVWYFFLRKKKDEYQFSSVNIKPITPGTTSKTDDSGFIAKLKSSGRNVVVFYGSQTGTAEDLANRLAKDAQRFGLKGVALDPEECDMEDLPRVSEIENALVIFCLSTYGEGDPTDNAQEFYEFLQRGDADLAGLNYAVFSLGNKTYEHYNAMGKYTDKRLEELGAKRVYEVGLGTVKKSFCINLLRFFFNKVFLHKTVYVHEICI